MMPAADCLRNVAVCESCESPPVADCMLPGVGWGSELTVSTRFREAC
jgi:hypothetical protein